MVEFFGSVGFGGAGRKMMRWAAIAVLAGSLIPILGASPNRLREYPNPSITVRSIAQGPDGFLWLAANDGLYRFDGLHFRKIPDYPFFTARQIVSTRDGSLWIGSGEGLVRYNGHFQVVAQDDILELAGLPEDVIAKLGLHDHLRVHIDGSIQRFSLYVRGKMTPDASGRLWYIGNLAKGVCWTTLDRLDTNRWERLPVSGDFLNAVVDGEGKLWLADQAHAVALRDGRLVAELHRRPTGIAARADPLLPGRNGQVWFLGNVIQGNNPAIVFRDRQKYDVLDVSAAFEDRRGHLWAAMPGRGLVEWIPDASWDRGFPEDLGNQPALQVVRTGEGELIAATKAGLFQLRRDQRKWSPLADAVPGVISLLPLPAGGFLAAMETRGVVRLSSSGRVMEQLPNPLASDDYRAIQRDRLGRYWVGHASQLFRVEGTPGAYRLRPSPLPGQIEDHPVNASDLEIAADGKLWVGYENGIAWLDEAEHWHLLPMDRPLDGVLSFSPPDAGHPDIWLAEMGKNRWAGHDGARLVRLTRTGERWTVHEFTAKEGYEAPATRFVKRDSRGWIWRGAIDGVYVSNGRDVAPNDWLHFGTRNGLAAESTYMYGFLEDRDGSVWISGEGGLSHLHPDKSWFDAPSSSRPNIDWVEADGVAFRQLDAAASVLAGKPGLVRIEAGSLDAPAFRVSPLRYRLLPSMADWKLSSDGTMEFRNLAVGEHRLELAWAGIGASPPSQFPFRIGPVTKHLSRLWLWMIPGIFLAALLFARTGPERFRYRLQKAIFVFRRRWIAAERGSVEEADGDHTGETLLGRYRLLRPISRGGFSIVYEGRDLTGDAARVAVKVMNVSARDENWVRDRFAYEVASLRSVNHPGVVAILDSWVSPQGRPCLVMPFLGGPTLRDAMTGGPFPKPRATRVIRKLGGVLAEVHSRGIVHRDLKPENVILMESGTVDERPVLIDFGMASLRGGEDRMWNTTLLGGSFHYMAPERLTGHYSQSSDVYSFGVIILELLTGCRLPDLNVMISDARFPEALENALGQVTPPDRRQRLVRNLCACYSADPQRRPKDVGAWTEEVAALLEDA